MNVTRNVPRATKQDDSVERGRDSSLRVLVEERAGLKTPKGRVVEGAVTLEVIAVLELGCDDEPNIERELVEDSMTEEGTVDTTGDVVV